MNNNKNWLVNIFVVVGLIFIISSIIQVGRIHNYSSTIGQFSNSSRYDGHSSVNKKTYYIWKYDFTVNEEKYKARSGHKYLSEPFNKEEKILYDPKDPYDNLLATDYTRYHGIYVGIIILYMAYYLSNIQNNSKTETKTLLLLILGGCFLYLLEKVNFSLGALFNTFSFLIIMILVFWFIGMFLRKKSNNQNIDSENIEEKKHNS